MKLPNAILISFLTFIPFQSAISANQFYTVVPFDNFILQPNNVIQANYSFAGHPLIYCFENTFQMIGLMQWPYKGQTFAANLSQSTISINPGSFEGFPADFSGIITITNNTNTALVVSCEFGF